VSFAARRGSNPLSDTRTRWSQGSTTSVFRRPRPRFALVDTRWTQEGDASWLNVRGVIMEVNGKETIVVNRDQENELEQLTFEAHAAILRGPRGYIRRAARREQGPVADLEEGPIRGSLRAAGGLGSGSTPRVTTQPPVTRSRAAVQRSQPHDCLHPPVAHLSHQRSAWLPSESRYPSRRPPAVEAIFESRPAISLPRRLSAVSVSQEE
jgi:hypothetical protein